MKQWALVSFILVVNGFLFATEKGEFPSSWKQVQPIYGSISQTQSIVFPESESVELFESVLLIKNNLYFQTKNKEKEISIFYLHLPTGEWKKKNWDKGKIFGWTECGESLLIQTKQKLYELDAENWNVKKESTFSSKSSNWKDIVCIEKQLYRLGKDQLEVYDLETLEPKPEISLPMKSVQRIVKRNENEILLYSSFSGNNTQLFSIKDKTTIKDWKFPTNHRALFKLVSISPDRYFIYDPITKIVGEWLLFDDHLFSVSEGLEIRADEKAVRFSPLHSKLEYQLEVTAKSEIPETSYHVVIPKKETYAQTLREETFHSPSLFGLDETGNRTLTLTLPAMKEGESKVLNVYKGNLTRYKIHWKLDPNLTVNREDVTSKYPNELRDDWFVKLEDPIVVEKRNELFQDKTSVKEILLETAKYVSSIPYKSGKFESAPYVIQKNNGGCTEHSYVTMSLLRGIGIPSRLVWNYLPTESSDVMSLNHKYVEVWVDGYGWIPMEPLAPPRSKPGVSYARHLVFAVLSTPKHPKILAGDRLVQLSKESFPQSKKLQMKLSILKQDVGEKEEESLELQPSQKGNRVIFSGEDLVVP